jgi:hypothetical protein
METLHTASIAHTHSMIQWNGKEGGAISATSVIAKIGSGRKWRNAKVKTIYSISLAKHGIAVLRSHPFE